MAGGRANEEELNDLVDEITEDAHGDDEQLWAFLQAFEEVTLTADAFVAGEPLSVITIDYDGNERRGLVARCRREDGAEYLIAASDVVFPEGSPGARYVAAYRTWLGIEPYQDVVLRKRPKATEDDLDMRKNVELIALAVKGNAVSCRILGKERLLTLRPGRPWEVVPGEIITVSPGRKWRYGGHPYLAGEITAWRIDVPALGLTPLALKEVGVWDPGEHPWGGPDEPRERWVRSLIKRGPRPEYEMEQALPGEDPDDPDTDPILDAIDLKRAGDHRGADRVLMNLLAADLRCLDAHAHLGDFAFHGDPDTAIRHYDMGVKIAEFSLGKDFDGLLPWDRVDNRPFLRCLHGYGLCLWRFGRFRDAEKVFTHMLWLGPADNQGARSHLNDVKEGRAWHE
jgi:hypothetical protein